MTIISNICRLHHHSTRKRNFFTFLLSLKQNSIKFFCASAHHRTTPSTVSTESAAITGASWIIAVIGAYHRWRCCSSPLHLIRDTSWRGVVWAGYYNFYTPVIPAVPTSKFWVHTRGGGEGDVWYAGFFSWCVFLLYTSTNKRNFRMFVYTVAQCVLGVCVVSDFHHTCSKTFSYVWK